MNATTLVLRQHRKIQQRLDALASDGYRRSRCLADLVDDMVTHLVVEASLLYPAAQTALGTSLKAERALHGRAKDLVLQLAAAPPPGPAFLEKVRELATVFAAHVAHDERVLLPSMARALDETKLDELGEDMDRLSCALIAKSRPLQRTPGLRPSGRAA